MYLRHQPQSSYSGHQSNDDNVKSDLINASEISNKNTEAAFGDALSGAIVTTTNFFIPKRGYLASLQNLFLLHRDKASF